MIGGLYPLSWVVYLRSGDSQWMFRTTDLSDVRYSVNAHKGLVEVNSSSTLRNQKLSLRIQSKVPISGFSAKVYIPTPLGFSNTPGCVETYTACATATVTEYDPGAGVYVEKFTGSFPLTALEFGGDFQNVIMKN